MKHTLRKLIVFGLIGLLSSSFILNLFLYERAHAYYVALNAINLDPLGLDVYPSTPQPGITNENEQLVVFYGDSRAAQWVAPTDTAGFKFVNRGIGNQTSAQVQQRFDAHIRPLNPDIIILQVCINDLKTIPLFQDRKTAIIENCQNNIELIVAEANEIGSTLIVSTIFPTGKIHPARKMFWSPEIEEAVLEVNSFIRSMESDKVIVFDSYELLVGENGRVLPTYNRDTLHLTTSGYNHLNNPLVTLLASQK